MRKSIAISLLFLILFTGTGCVRLFCECCPKEFLENEMANSLVSRWIEFNLGDWHKPQRDVESLVDILTLLIKNGFPPVCEGEESRIYSNKTSLDVVLDNAAMKTSAKDRLVAAMRAHGAKVMVVMRVLQLPLQ